MEKMFSPLPPLRKPSLQEQSVSHVHESTTTIKNASAACISDSLMDEEEEINADDDVKETTVIEALKRETPRIKHMRFIFGNFRNLDRNLIHLSTINPVKLEIERSILKIGEITCFLVDNDAALLNLKIKAGEKFQKVEDDKLDHQFYSDVMVSVNRYYTDTCIIVYDPSGISKGAVVRPSLSFPHVVWLHVCHFVFDPSGSSPSVLERTPQPSHITLSSFHSFLYVSIIPLFFSSLSFLLHRLNDLMESKGGKKKSSNSSSKSSFFYGAPLGHIIEDIRPNGGIKKFRSTAYSNCSCKPS